MTQKINFNNLTGNSITIGNTVIDGTGITTNGETVAGIKANIYANNASLPLSGLTAGMYAYTTANTTLFYTDGNGWYRVTTINETPSVTLSVGSVTLGADGNTADITYTASDPDGFPVTVTVSNSGIANTSLANVQLYTSNNTITINNVGFSESNNFTVTVSASDGINIGIATANVIVNFPVPDPVATGGSIGTYTDGGTTYKYHKFTTAGTFSVTDAPAGAVFDMLVVAGGGGGGRGSTSGGVGEVAGGGGAGGLVYVNQKPLTTGSYSISVGSAGLGYNSDNASGDGGDSVALGYTAKGGGGGAYRNGGSTTYQGRPGGSGGGPHRNSTAGQSTQDTYSSDSYATGYGNDSGGGVSATAMLASGGGAGGAGTAFTYDGNADASTVAAGGAGKIYNIDGTSRTYSRGGDSVAFTTGGTSNAGVFGGGGRGYRETNAGEDAQPGIVIIRYQIQ